MKIVSGVKISKLLGEGSVRVPIFAWLVILKYLLQLTLIVSVILNRYPLYIVP